MEERVCVLDFVCHFDELFDLGLLQLELFNLLVFLVKVVLLTNDCRVVNVGLINVLVALVGQLLVLGLKVFCVLLCF